MKKIVALTGVVGFLAVVLVFSACATMSTWWSGPWIWGATAFLSEGYDPDGAKLPKVVLSGSNQNPSGVFVDANKEEYVMTEIDLSKKGLILFVVNGEQKEGEFDFENGRIIEK
jgi:hypothetical protein